MPWNVVQRYRPCADQAQQRQDLQERLSWATPQMGARDNAVKAGRGSTPRPRPPLQPQRGDPRAENTSQKKPKLAPTPIQDESSVHSAPFLFFLSARTLTSIRAPEEVGSAQEGALAQVSCRPRRRPCSSGRSRPRCRSRSGWQM